jgi:hypothetical protein
MMETFSRGVSRIVLAATRLIESGSGSPEKTKPVRPTTWRVLFLKLKPGVVKGEICIRFIPVSQSPQARFD